MPWLAALAAGAGAAGQIGSAAIAANQVSQSREQAYNLAQQSISDLTAIGVPPAEAQQIVMQKYESAGQLTPELEQAIKQGPSELNNIQTNPNDMAAQEQALKELQNVGNQGGMRLSDLQTQNQGLNNIRASTRGANEAIEQNMREKQQFGGGAELASKLANQQNSATQANQLGLGVNATAQDRALQAIMSSGQLGQSMQGQEFNQKSQQAASQNAINQFNAQNNQGVVQRNVANMNQARGYNLTNNQNLMNANTTAANQNAVRNSDLIQIQYQNELQKAGIAANARAGQASNIVQGGANTAAAITAAGKGINQAGTTLGQYYASQPTKQNNSDDDDPQERMIHQ